MASVSAKNGDSAATDDNEASFSNIFTTTKHEVIITNDNGQIKVEGLYGLRVVGAERVSAYAQGVANLFPDNKLLESQAALTAQLSKNANLVETFATNFLGLFTSAIDKTQANFDAASTEATAALTKLTEGESTLAAKQTSYDTAFSEAITLKEQAAEAQADQAANEGQIMIGAAATRAQATVGLEFSVSDAQDAADAAAALTFGASNGANGTTEVSNAGVVTYAADADAVQALAEDESFTDTISYATRLGEKEFEIQSIDVTVTKTEDGVSITDLSSLQVKGAKQLAADATAEGLSASAARKIHEEVDYLLGTEASPGLVRSYVDDAQNAATGASGALGLILETLDLTAAEFVLKATQQDLRLAGSSAADNYYAAASKTLAALGTFESKADAFADLADALEATSGASTQGFVGGIQKQAIDPAAIAQALINSAREIAQKTAEGAMNAEADAT